MRQQSGHLAIVAVVAAVFLSCQKPTTAAAQEAETEQPTPQYELAISLIRFGDVYLKLGQIENSQYNYELALKPLQELVDANPDNAQFRRDLARCKTNLGVANLALKATRAAESNFAGSAEILEGLLEADPENQQTRLELVRAWKNLFDLSLQRDDDESALRYYRQWQDVRKSIKAEARRLETQGDILVEESDVDGGVKLYNQSIKLLENVVRTETRDEQSTGVRLSPWYREGATEPDQLLIDPTGPPADRTKAADGIKSPDVEPEPMPEPPPTEPPPTEPLPEAGEEPDGSEPPAPTGDNTSKKKPPYFVREVFFATDRKAERQGIAEGRPEASTYFTAEAGDVTYGVCEVSIPSRERRAPGVLTAPSLVRLEFDWDPKKHVTLLKVEPLAKDALLAGMKKTWPTDVKPAEREIFVFVHGFNVSFEDAARRTAQMAWDVGFVGPAVMFSWPSQGGLTRYTTDEEYVDLGAADLQQFLMDLVQQSGAARFHLIAHSMGTRVMTQAIERVVLRHAASGAPPKKLFNQVVLAAPDINAEYFNRYIAPQIVPFTERTTLYVSSKDRALLASRNFHGGVPRVGESTSPIRHLAGMDVVDASAIDTSALGHSYYGDRPEILDDLNKVMQQVAISERGLRHAGRNRYVFIPKQVSPQDEAARNDSLAVLLSGLIPLLLVAVAACAYLLVVRKRAA